MRFLFSIVPRYGAFIRARFIHGDRGSLLAYTLIRDFYCIFLVDKRERTISQLTHVEIKVERRKFLCIWSKESSRSPLFTFKASRSDRDSRRLRRICFKVFRFANRAWEFPYFFFFSVTRSNNRPVNAAKFYYNGYPRAEIRVAWYHSSFWPLLTANKTI